MNYDLYLSLDHFCFFPLTYSCNGIILYPVACRGLVISGANSLIGCLTDSSIKPSIEKYFEKRRYFEDVSKKGIQDKNLIQFEYKFQNHYHISLSDWMPPHLDA